MPRLIDADKLNDGMDDLISRKAAVNAVKGLLLDGSTQQVWSSDVLDTLANVPAVEAVPLEPLCNLLQDIVGGLCINGRGEDKCFEVVGDSCNPKWTDKECWTHFLRAWMKQRRDEP